MGDKTIVIGTDDGTEGEEGKQRLQPPYPPLPGQLITETTERAKVIVQAMFRDTLLPKVDAAKGHGWSHYTVHLADTDQNWVLINNAEARKELRRQAAAMGMAVRVWPNVTKDGWEVALDWSKRYRLGCSDCCSCWIPCFWPALCWWQCGFRIWTPCGCCDWCCCEP